MELVALVLLVWVVLVWLIGLVGLVWVGLVLGWTGFGLDIGSGWSRWWYMIGFRPSYYNVIRRVAQLRSVGSAWGQLTSLAIDKEVRRSDRAGNINSCGSAK